MFCVNCGNQIAENSQFCPKCGREQTGIGVPIISGTPTPPAPMVTPKQGTRFQTAKLVIGIISIVLFFLIAFQSCAMGVLNSMDGNGSVSGSMGMFLAICWIIAGIVGIATRKSKSGAWVVAAFYSLAGLVGAMDIGEFADLQIYVALSFAFAGLFALSAILKNDKKQ